MLQGLDFFLCGWFGGNSLLIWTTLPYNSNSTILWGCQLLLKLAITDLYAYFIFVESLHYKVLIFWLCRLFGGNSLLILTTLPYKCNPSIQWGCQLLLILAITDVYANCIFIESLCYKVLIFCVCGSFGRNILLILTTLDVFQPKISCSLSLSGMQRQIFLDRRNRTNSR